MREIVRIRAVCRSSHFISCWKRGSMCTCLIRNLSQRGQRRENRERERKRERERREHFRFRGSGELIKLPFRSGPRRQLNRKFFWPGGYHLDSGSHILPTPRRSRRLRILALCPVRHPSPQWSNFVAETPSTLSSCTTSSNTKIDDGTQDQDSPCPTDS